MLRTYLSKLLCVDWNGARSPVFAIVNGAKHGGVINPVLFCVYINDLLCLPAKSNVWCYLGSWFLGALAYADDIVILALTSSAMRSMLKICDEYYTSEHSIVFNADKSIRMYFVKGCMDRSSVLKPVFYVGDNAIDYFDKWSNLGHILSSDWDDKSDISNCRNAPIGQINSVLRYFGKLNSIVKLRLMVNNCYSLYMAAFCGMLIILH